MDRHVIRVCEWFVAVLVGAAILDLVGAWIWLSFIHDGPEFPY